MTAPTDPLRNTRDVYERRAREFDRERTKTLFERPWLERFCASLNAGARILDLGCGSGEPIARYLIAKGFAVTGVDFSEALLALARERFPGQRWIHCDLRELALNARYDAIIAWHSLFHLTPVQQRLALPRIVSHLEDGGRLMATLAPEAGETTGWAGGEEIYHGGLAASEYRALLEGCGLNIDAFAISDPECGGASVVLATKNTA